MDTPLKIAFFGTPEIAVCVLQEMEKAGLMPELVVTNPDRPQGRGLALQASPVKQWAQDRAISILQPESLTEAAMLPDLVLKQWDLFIVVAYGLIMPQWLIELPQHGTLNIHPSLLPKLRGASPIRTSILNNYEHMGVSVMLMDEKMDHGPILAQEAYAPKDQPSGTELDMILARKGGTLLVQTIPSFVSGALAPQEQDHSAATYSKKITKEMARLELDPLQLPTGEDAHRAFLKIQAFDGWPGAFFFYNNKRIKIVSAGLQDNALQIHSVIPEGKKQMSFSQFLANVTS